jgi:hypothetical protein
VRGRIGRILEYPKAIGARLRLDDHLVNQVKGATKLPLESRCHAIPHAHGYQDRHKYREEDVPPGRVAAEQFPGGMLLLQGSVCMSKSHRRMLAVHACNTPLAHVLAIHIFTDNKNILVALTRILSWMLTFCICSYI